MSVKSSSSDQKRKTLLIRLNILVFVATSVYAILDLILGIDVAFYIYLSFFLFAVINALLIHYGHIEACKIFALLVFNVMIFLVSTSEPFSTGMFLHFVSAGTAAIALYGYEQWKGAIAFVLLSLVLDITTFTTELRVIPWRDVNDEQARFFFILNTFIAASISVYTIMLYSKINYESEKTLEQNQKLIRQQNEQLIKANSELDKFVYSASHDLRAPLSTLTGLINLSEADSNNDSKSQYLKLMRDRIRSMDTFISEIIDYSRNTRLEVKNTAVNVKDLLETIVDDIQFTQGGILVKWDFEEELLIKTDEVRFKMVFSNLISNAYKYYDPHKKPQWLKLAGCKENGCIKIVVQDNGIGIKRDFQDKIFDMFFQAHAHSSGSGLGLYIAKETLTKLDGKIEIESEEGLGTTFTTYLPVC